MKKRRTVGTFLPPEQPQNNPEGVSQRVARNLFWLILDKMVALANALVIGALVARYLGPAGFGLLGTALAVWIIASNIAEGGLRKVVVRKMVIAPDGTKQLLGAGLRLRFLLSAAILLLLYALIFGTSWIATGPLERAVFALVLAGLLVEPLRVADYLIEARLLGYVEARTTTLTLLLLAALRVTLVVGEAPLLAFAGAMLLEQISIAVFRFLLAGRATGVWPASSLLAGQSWRLLKASSPMLLSGLFVSLYMYVDLPMLRALAGDEEAGYYAAAIRISSVFLFLPTAAAASLYPFIIECVKAGATAKETILRDYFRAFALAGYLVALGTAMAAPLVIPLLFGEAFLPSVPVLAVHGCFLLFVMVAVARASWLFAHERFGLSSGIDGLLLLANLSLNLLLIPRFGALGAAGATVGCYFLGIVLPPLLFWKDRELLWPPLQGLLWPWPSTQLWKGLWRLTKEEARRLVSRAG